jgi:hypothetical protein
MELSPKIKFQRQSRSSLTLLRFQDSTSFLDLSFRLSETLKDSCYKAKIWQSLRLKMSPSRRHFSLLKKQIFSRREWHAMLRCFSSKLIKRASSDIGI